MGMRGSSQDTGPQSAAFSGMVWIINPTVTPEKLVWRGKLLPTTQLVSESDGSISERTRSLSFSDFATASLSLKGFQHKTVAILVFPPQP